MFNKGRALLLLDLKSSFCEDAGSPRIPDKFNASTCLGTLLHTHLPSSLPTWAQVPHAGPDPTRMCPLAVCPSVKASSLPSIGSFRLLRDLLSTAVASDSAGSLHMHPHITVGTLCQAVPPAADVLLALSSSDSPLWAASYAGTFHFFLDSEALDHLILMCTSCPGLTLNFALLLLQTLGLKLSRRGEIKEGATQVSCQK